MNVAALAGFVTTLAISLLSESVLAQSALPKFEVTSRAGNAVVLLVSKSTTKDQFVVLVREFQKAKREGNFGRLIPSTTPGGSRGSYAGVQVFVMDDPKLATNDSIKRVLRVDWPPPDPFVQKFANGVRAYYMTTVVSSEEICSLGYDDGDIKGVDYKELC